MFNKLTDYCVGILIPTYNRKPFLQLALASAINQTYEHIEIIVIDNGSIDQTAEYMTGITDQRVKYLRNEQNIGLIGSINKGIQLFSENVIWCTILGDDDLLDKNFIASMISLVNKNPSCSVIHSHRIIIDQISKILREASLAPQLETSYEFILNRSKRKRVSYLTGVFFSRDAFEEIGGYPKFTTGLASDDAFIFALSLKDKLVFNKNAECSIRLHPESESLEASNALAHLQTLDEFKQYLEKAAVAHGKYGTQKLAELRRILNNYVKFLSSHYWVKNIQFLMKENSGQQEMILYELIRVTEDKKNMFSARVSFDSFCMRKFKICPENSKLYISMWRGINLIKMILKI